MANPPLKLSLSLIPIAEVEGKSPSPLPSPPKTQSPRKNVPRPEIAAPSTPPPKLIGVSISVGEVFSKRNSKEKKRNSPPRIPGIELFHSPLAIEGKRSPNGSPKRERKDNKIPISVTQQISKEERAKIGSPLVKGASEEKKKSKPLGERRASSTAVKESHQGITARIIGGLKAPFQRSSIILNLKDEDENFLCLIKTGNDELYEIPGEVLSIVSRMENEKTGNTFVDLYEELAQMLEARFKLSKLKDRRESFQVTCEWLSAQIFKNKNELAVFFDAFSTGPTSHILQGRIEKLKRELREVPIDKSSEDSFKEFLELIHSKNITSNPLELARYMSSGLNKNLIRLLTRALGGAPFIGKLYILHRYFYWQEEISKLSSKRLKTTKDIDYSKIGPDTYYQAARALMPDSAPLLTHEFNNKVLNFKIVEKHDDISNRLSYFRLLFLHLNKFIKKDLPVDVLAFLLVKEYRMCSRDLLIGLDEKAGIKENGDPIYICRLSELVNKLIDDLNIKLEILTILMRDDVITEDSVSKICQNALNSWDNIKKIINLNCVVITRFLADPAFSERLAAFNEVTFNVLTFLSLGVAIEALKNLKIPHASIVPEEAKNEFIRELFKDQFSYDPIIRVVVSTAVIPSRLLLTDCWPSMFPSSFEEGGVMIEFDSSKNGTHTCLVNSKKQKVDHRIKVPIVQKLKQGKNKIGTIELGYRIQREMKAGTFVHKSRLTLSGISIDESNPVFMGPTGHSLRLKLLEKISELIQFLQNKAADRNRLKHSKHAAKTKDVVRTLS